MAHGVHPGKVGFRVRSGGVPPLARSPAGQLLERVTTATVELELLGGTTRVVVFTRDP